MSTNERGNANNPPSTVSRLPSEESVSSNLTQASDELPSLSVTHKRPHSARLKSHHRSSSHNKLLNKLSASASASASALATARPNLNRSKSTDGLMKRQNAALKRSNRSFTKVAGLQPLTKTMSNQSLKSNKSNTSLKAMSSNIKLKASKPIMRLHDDDENDDEYEDLGDAGTEPNAPAPERFDSQETVSTVGLTFQPNVPSLYEQINRMVPDPTPQTEPKLEVLQETSYSRPETFSSNNNNNIINNNNINSSNSNRNIGNNDGKNDARDYNGDGGRGAVPPIHSTQSSTDDLSQAANLYGGSLLLSQSTGVVRKIDPVGIKETISTGFKHRNTNVLETLGISFKANPIDPQSEKNRAAEPVITSQNISQRNSYQPDQTIMSNLQRTNDQYKLQIDGPAQQNYVQKAQRAQQAQQAPPTQAPLQQRPHHQPQQQPLRRRMDTTFERERHDQSKLLNDINKSGSTPSFASDHGSSKNIETRTQQKLWLQRESSLMDVANMDHPKLGNFSSLSLNNLMFSNSYNSNGSLRDYGYGHVFGGGGGGVGGSSGAVGTGTVSSNNYIKPMTPITPGGVNGLSGFNFTPALDLPINAHSIQNFVQNIHQTSIQSRTEFERLNREYLNVRRHHNPMAESLKRISTGAGESEIKIEKRNNKRGNNNQSIANDFNDFAPAYKEKRSEAAGTVNRIWQDAIFSIASSLSPNKSTSGALENTRPSNTRMTSVGKHSQFSRHGQHAK
ncbi:hypothetical protein LELG_01792 [Lodderomyces elongisporus NRRL YB-4239]|uniref:Target of rapamycin complex 1 subunit TCO89 n=1 Tax=Lodderomyces elongisporus (strain ATCC 11503 / CBS 2605 / JCM 1781 / NBRC 1676 / NRRL YB-4239) TaxID=379508 RepID=A5DWQ5_LODEL|nr:hypothetical protein LELG_01792 [Lodderomyces elongisporus NRRL YB-4239]